MSKFLITGGAGFIGSNFLQIMVNKYPNDEYICLDALTYAGNIETLKNISNKKNFRFIQLSICDKKSIFKLFEKECFDYIINFAAETHVDNSIKSPTIFLKTNILGTQILMDACRKYGIKRFHQISTDEVYGDLPLNGKKLFFTETSQLRASSPYSASKASADLLVLAYYRTYKLPVTISRCSNNYGPYQFPEKLIPLIINNALANKELPIYGEGKNIRDWIYVSDHCNAVDLIVRYGKDGEIYNISGCNEKTNLEIVTKILKILGRSEALIKHVADRPGHDQRYAIDSSKLFNELGWKPEINFNKGIKKTVKWNLENQDWIEHIKLRKNK